jgi:hypothetical protein
MKAERFIILLLLLIICILAWHKKPEHTHYQTDHVIETLIVTDKKIVDSLKVEIAVLNSRKPIIITRIDSIKAEVKIAEIDEDTLKIIQEQRLVILEQDTLIESLNLEVEYYDDLVVACDSVMSNQQKLIELKDTVIVDQKKVIKKQNRRKKIGRFFAMVGGAILGTLLILK